MSNLKLTQWFDGSKFVPAHVGVYERDFSFYPDLHTGEILWFSKWNGKKWGMRALTPYSAELKSGESICQDLPWRGLAENP